MSGWMALANTASGLVDGATDYFAAKQWEKKFKEEQKDQEEYATAVGDSANVRYAAMKAAEQYDPNSSLGALAGAGISNLFKKREEKEKVDITPLVIQGVQNVGVAATSFIKPLKKKESGEVGNPTEKDNTPEVALKEPEKKQEDPFGRRANSPLLSGNLSLNSYSDKSSGGLGTSNKPFDPQLNIAMSNPPAQTPVTPKLNINTGSSIIAPPVGRTSGSDFQLTGNELKTGFSLLSSTNGFGQQMGGALAGLARLGIKIKLIPK